MPAPDRRSIGEDIQTVEFGWPIVMPTCRPMGGGLHEARTQLASGKIARMLFYIDKKQRMILLHGFIKKTQSTPTSDLELAKSNKRKQEEAIG